MNETPAATHRTHAGCGHLCLTCGAKAAHRYMKAPASPTVRGLTLSMLFFSAVFWCGMGFGLFFEWLGYPDVAPGTPPPDVQQRWSDATQSGFRLTLIADKDGRATFLVPLGMMCVASSEQGPVFSAADGTTRRAVRAEPGSVIHVGCW